MNQMTQYEDASNLTIWCDPDEIMAKTQYGRISYIEWCELELKRIGGNYHIAHANINGLRMVAIQRVK